MYGSALVAIDFSPATRSLLKRVNRLHRFGTQKLVLLHVMPKGGDADDALERLQTKAAKLDSAFEVECLVREGRPAQTIIDTAKERGTPLIVLASRNHSITRRLVLGSVADAVVHWSEGAVLLEDAYTGPEGEEREIPDGPVLLATDGSAISTAAEDVALQIAAGRTLEIVCVVDGDALETGWQITAKALEKAQKAGVTARRNVETGRRGDAIARTK